MSARCGATIPDFFAWAEHQVALATVCGRPEGHAGEHWPVPLVSDRSDQEQTQ